MPTVPGYAPTAPYLPVFSQQPCTKPHDPAAACKATHPANHEIHDCLTPLRQLPPNATTMPTELCQRLALNRATKHHRHTKVAPCSSLPSPLLRTRRRPGRSSRRTQPGRQPPRSWLLRDFSSRTPVAACSIHRASTLKSPVLPAIRQHRAQRHELPHLANQLSALPTGITLPACPSSP